MMDDNTNNNKNQDMIRPGECLIKTPSWKSRLPVRIGADSLEIIVESAMPKGLGYLHE